MFFFNIYLCTCLIYLPFVLSFFLSSCISLFFVSLSARTRKNVFRAIKGQKGSQQAVKTLPHAPRASTSPSYTAPPDPTLPLLASTPPRRHTLTSLHSPTPIPPQHLTSGFGFSVSFSVFRTISLTPFSVGSSQKHPNTASATFTSLHIPAIIPPPAPHFRIWFLFSLSHFSALPHTSHFLLGHIKNKVSSWYSLCDC